MTIGSTQRSIEFLSYIYKKKKTCAGIGMDRYRLILRICGIGSVLKKRYRCIPILDLVFSHGFSIMDIEIGNTGFSDHNSVTFTTALPRRPSTTSAQACWVRHFSPTACEDFATAYKATDELSITNRSSESSDADTYFTFFSNTCLSIVNNIARLKMKRSTKKICSLV